MDRTSSPAPADIPPPTELEAVEAMLQRAGFGYDRSEALSADGGPLVYLTVETQHAVDAPRPGYTGFYAVMMFRAGLLVGIGGEE